MVKSDGRRETVLFKSLLSLPATSTRIDDYWSRNGPRFGAPCTRLRLIKGTSPRCLHWISRKIERTDVDSEAPWTTVSTRSFSYTCEEYNTGRYGSRVTSKRKHTARVTSGSAVQTVFQFVVTYTLIALVCLDLIGFGRNRSRVTIQ